MSFPFTQVNMLASKLFAAPPLAWLQAPRGIRHLVLRAGVQRISKLFSPLSYRDIDLPYRPPLAGRKYLPGSELGGFPEFLPGPQESFPKAYWIEENKELDIDGWGMLCRSHIDNNLADYGAILYRWMLDPFTPELKKHILATFWENVWVR